MLEDKTPSVFPTPARTPRRSNEMESSPSFVLLTIMMEEKEIETQKSHTLDESSHFYPSANRLKKALSQIMFQQI